MTRAAEVPGAAAASALTAPIFIVAAPRAGARRLFSLLARSPSVWWLEEAERLVLARCAPEAATDRFDAALASVETRAACRAGVEAVAAGRAGAGSPAGRFLLDCSARNALRVPFLAGLFPDARFVYLFRDPREHVSRMLDAWRSGRYVSRGSLPGWSGPPWSLPLIPGWQFLDRLPLAEVVARQWDAITGTLLDDLAGLPADRWCVCSYDKLASDPGAELARLGDFLGLERDPAPGDLAASATLPIDRDQWRHNAAELRPAMPLVLDTAERARALFAHAPASRATMPTSPADAPVRPASMPRSTPPTLGGVADAGFMRVLEELGSSLIATTQRGHRLVLLSAEAGQLRIHYRGFGSPLRLALGPRYLALAANRHVWLYRNQPEAGRRLGPSPPDACFMPHALQVTGDLGVRDATFVGDRLCLASARFSCLAAVEEGVSFRPAWRPPFVSVLAAEDRCHLNGLAVVGDQVRYATALGRTDGPNGWQARRVDGGCVIDVADGRIVADSLCLPHTPRWHQGSLWLAEAGQGRLGRLDGSGRLEPVAELPGFARGLAFAGPYAFVGVSRVRAGTYAWSPLLRRCEGNECGIRVVDTRSGAIVGALRLTGPVEEVLDIVVLPGVRMPELVEPEADLVANTFVLPEESL